MAEIPKDWREVLHQPPPRSGAVVNALVRETTKLMRWALIIVIALDVAFVALTVFATNPAQRAQMAVAVTLVFGLLSGPFIYVFLRAINHYRALVSGGQLIEATVDEVASRRPQQNPFHHVTVRFHDPAGKPCTGQFSVAGGEAGLRKDDTLDLLCNFELDKPIVAVLTPRHGLQPGRWSRN